MDIIAENHQCTIRWDGTDGPRAAQILDLSSPPQPGAVITGTFVCRSNRAQKYDADLIARPGQWRTS